MPGPGGLILCWGYAPIATGSAAHQVPHDMSGMDMSGMDMSSMDMSGTASGSLAWLPVSGTRITLTVDYTNHRYRDDYGIPSDGDRPADVPLHTAYND